MIRPVIYISQILALADAFHKRFGRWPRYDDGRVAGMIDLTWGAIDQALRKGHRGLLPGSSLARLLLEHRSVRHRNYLPRLTYAMIIAWAKAHRLRTGKWPTLQSGQIVGAPGETWLGIQKSLLAGRRGLPGGLSLGELLAKRLGVRNNTSVPRLSQKLVLEWADAHFKRTGHWPTRSSGLIREARGETWAAVDAAFVQGLRGLAGFGSLARFLAKKRGVRNRKALPDFRAGNVVAWAKAFRNRTGKLPKHTSGPIPEAPGETWGGVHAALYRGSRGMAQSSLYLFLRKHFDDAR
jgi:hypothetical protein